MARARVKYEVYHNGTLVMVGTNVEIAAAAGMSVGQIRDRIYQSRPIRINGKACEAVSTKKNVGTTREAELRCAGPASTRMGLIARGSQRTRNPLTAGMLLDTTLSCETTDASE